MRGCDHSKDIREYEITSEGVIILGERLAGYEGLVTGIPRRLSRSGQKEGP
jgi:circadian clock protein KaiC